MADDCRVEPDATFAGEPDAFGRLWTPHRMVYIKGENKPSHDEAGDDCPFCAAPGRSDEDGLIVARGALRLRGAQPVPVQLRAPDDRAVPARRRLHRSRRRRRPPSSATFTQTAMTVIRAVMAPHGFNIGMNQGVGRRRRHRRAPAPARRARAGAATPTSCRSSRTPGCCPSCCPTPGAMLAEAWADRAAR